MSKDDKELHIDVPAHIREQMVKDPALGEALRQMFAAMHQAHQGVIEGRYETFDDAMEAITGNRPKPVNLKA